LTTVDGGAGNDKIFITKNAGAALSVQGGDGNDTIALTGTLATTDVINGGAGTDTVSLTGAATRSADDYIVFNKLITGFEAIKFDLQAELALDASQLAANYATIDLFNGSAVTKVGTQALIAHGGLTATANGYSVATSGTVTYAGTLNITEKVTGLVTANADTVSLAVKAGAADVIGTLAGDVKTANIALTNSVDNADDPTVDTIATVNVVSSATSDKAMTTLTLSGNGFADVSNTATGKLVNVDASGLGGTYTVGVKEGVATDGLQYISANGAAETIKLGSGVDHIALNASTYGKVDSVSGLHLVANAAGTAMAAGSDLLNVASVVVANVAKFTTTQTDLDLALHDAALSNKGDTLVFSMGGDTYIYVDNNATGGGVTDAVDATDTVVKIVGGVDLDTLILSLGTPV
jgi:hypothetical protein